MSRSKKLKMLTTVKAVLEVLGGYAVAGKMTGRSDQAAWNWTVQHTFPSNTYVVMTTALADAGYEAPPSLWGMTPAAAVVAA